MESVQHRFFCDQVCGVHLLNTFVNETALKLQASSLKSSKEHNDMKYLYKLVNGFIDCAALIGELMFKFPIRITRQSITFAVGNYSPLRATNNHDEDV